jgi:hypothetical protein
LTYAADLHPVRRRFTGIDALDCSNLDAVRRRLKTLWNDHRVPLGGAILARYGICEGVLRDLHYKREVASSEFTWAVDTLTNVAKETLLVGDRLYGTPKFVEACTKRDLFLVARLFSPSHVRRIGESVQVPHPDGGVIEDFEAEFGSGQTAEVQTVRVIRWRKGRRTKLEIVTNVLDRKRLSARDAMLVYRFRWKVERFFFDLKSVLNLDHLYAANTNAVALQLYATAILHTAMRVCHARIAQRAKVEPEEISTKKLYPQLARISRDLAAWHSAIAVMKRLNPTLDLKTPDDRQMPGAFIALSKILVEPRRSTARRRKRRLAGWRSLPRPRPSRRPELS